MNKQDKTIAPILGIILRFFIYPFEGDKTKKTIHIPLQKGSKWSWPAFIIPEFWFLWHEIWGISIIVFLIEFFGGFLLISYDLPFTALASIIFLIRIISGRIGDTIYFCKYGRWLNERYNNEEIQFTIINPTQKKS